MTAVPTPRGAAAAEPAAPGPTPAELRAHWLLDPAVRFLNHGSFGACPLPVLEAQDRWRRRLEREPVQFMVHELEPALDAARGALAAFLGAGAGDLVFVPNATTGVNAVLRSLPLAAGDEVLTTDHAYAACRSALGYTAERRGAAVVVAHLPFPLAHPDQVVDAVLRAVTPRTRVALLDHVTSATGLVLPIERLVSALRERGVDALVDGAHAPGMLELDVPRVGAAYYTGNCHKWICAPKGAAFLWVRPDLQADVRPLTISHGAAATRGDRKRFLAEFDWVGTHDPTAYLAVPAALEFLGGLLPGGWPQLRQRNRELALHGRAVLCDALGIEPPAPADMIGSLAAVPIPDGDGARPTKWQHVDPLQAALRERHAIQVPVSAWPTPPKRVLRISAQAYNAPEEYGLLAAALAAELAAR